MLGLVTSPMKGVLFSGPIWVGELFWFNPDENHNLMLLVIAKVGKYCCGVRFFVCLFDACLLVRETARGRSLGAVLHVLDLQKHIVVILLALQKTPGFWGAMGLIKGNYGQPKQHMAT